MLNLLWRHMISIDIYKSLNFLDGWRITVKDQHYFGTLIGQTFLNCIKTAKAERLKLCRFSEQLSEHIFVKFPSS